MKNDKSMCVRMQCDRTNGAISCGGGQLFVRVSREMPLLRHTIIPIFPCYMSCVYVSCVFVCLLVYVHVVLFLCCRFGFFTSSTLFFKMLLFSLEILRRRYIGMIRMSCDTIFCISFCFDELIKYNCSTFLFWKIHP